MHHDYHYVLMVCHAQQAHTHERPASQVEWLRYLFQGKAYCFLPCVGFAGNVRHRNGQAQPRSDHLHGPPVYGLKRCAQYFVSLYDFVYGPLKRAFVKLAREPDRCVNIVSGGAALNLVDDPQLLLVNREGPGALAFSLADGLRFWDAKPFALEP